MVFGMFLFLHDDNELLRELKVLKEDYFIGNEWNECESVVCLCGR